MCAKDGESWSVVVPPEGAVPGDRVVFDTYPGIPDAQLNPKKKVQYCAMLISGIRPSIHLYSFLNKCLWCSIETSNTNLLHCSCLSPVDLTQYTNPTNF